MTSTVFPMIIKNALGAGMILQLWHVNTNLVLRGFVEVHTTEPDSMIRILEICQELKVNLDFHCYFFPSASHCEIDIYAASDC